MIPVYIAQQNNFEYNKKGYNIYDKTNLSALKFNISYLNYKKIRTN